MDHPPADPRASQTDRSFAGSIPALYDHYLGPLIFEPYAVDLAARLGDVRSGSVLETAAGTGRVTRALVRSLPAPVRIVATDLNQPMLDFAAARTDSARVTWRQADALDLPFANGTFDVVVCQFGAMFFPDRAAAYAQALRVLKPGGRLLFNVWGRIEDNELAHLVAEAVAGLFPEDPPRFLARTPYGYHDTAGIRDELQAAGFIRIAVETVEHRSRAASHRDPAIGFCQGSPLRNEIEARDPSRIEEATGAAAAAIAARFGFGPIDARIQAHVVTAFR
jgi:ubiquinone/menaquinone biosynthesis C-methylase UbiE